MNLEKKISLRLDTGLVGRLQARADGHRVPVSYILRHLVLRYLEGPRDTEDPPTLRPAGGGRVWVPADPDKLMDEFRDECCRLFDGFRNQGADVNGATRRVNFALKAKKHPWATYEVVAKALRDCGRFRTVRGVKR